MYLATVMILVPEGLHDLYSRKIVGWSMDDTMRVSLVNDALSMVILHSNSPNGLIWHMPKRSDKCPWCIDRGSQYASYSHKDLLQKHGIIQSMSRKGNCCDNSVAESFFKSLKQE